MEIVTGTITEAFKCLISPFMDRVNYLLHYKRNANDVRNQMARLEELKKDIQNSANEAHLRGEVIKGVVEGWIIRVNQLQSREKELQKALEESKGWLQGGCSGCSRRYQVGKDAKQMIDQVNDLLNEGRTFDAVSYPAPLPPGLETMQTKDFHHYDSTKLAMAQIMKALKDEHINMVGVYGIGGVGKTTLMKEVAKKLKNKGDFNQVVMVTVSQDPVWTKIQSEIAENLGLPLTQECLSVRARLLVERLNKEKRILIVLDDLWKPLNLLEQVGISCGNNCKVVLTTRQFEVCNQMGTQINVEVKVLSKGDSRVLFKWAAGDRVEDDHTLGPVAEQVIRECGGLPLAIITIGRALRTKDLSEWEDAASQLKKSSSSPPDIDGVHEKVFCSIKLSYDFLASDATKFCLLLCCMFPEDSSISEDDLLLYVVGEGVFENIHTLREARNRLHTQLERLKRSCLLLDDSERKEGCVRMHDIIRDVSIWIASKEGHHAFVVESGRGLTQFPDREELEKCKRLSLMQNKITKFPNQLNCSQLMTLALRGNKDLTKIPDGIFQWMKSLKNLDMEGIGRITFIPSSLSCLTDLRVLRININSWNTYDDSPLDVSLLGKLKKLEILHVLGCNVKSLPEEIGELSNLKSLNLSQNSRLNIATNTLLRLSLLEELYLENSFDKWEMEGSETEGSEMEGLEDGSKAC
ncbi:hypothetical protein NE237_018724 [Protea cynaroides]|uniref:AAA+ ATPase domain-containing protein n=1 Tax=Protea cynaroides TaxID=273540 RepID=A0A9Q0KAJ0_9MAGN|nr:hypothetical protein NE237_018724 [Protea cynaroides]